MRISLKFHGIVGDLIRPKIDVLEMADGATLANLIDELAGRSEKNAAVLRQAQAFVDGQLVDRSTPLNDGAVVTIMRPIGGG